MNDRELDYWRAAVQDVRSPLGAGPRFVALLIADYSREQGNPEDVAVSVDQVGFHSGHSRATVYRALDEMIREGFLAKTAPAVDGRPAKYRPLTPSHLADAVPDWPMQDYARD